MGASLRIPGRRRRRRSRGVMDFNTFVVSLARTAAVHFGDIADADGAKQPADLRGASQIIDILALLEEKTRGNLSAEERQILDQVLYELRLRFLQAQKNV